MTPINRAAAIAHVRALTLAIRGHDRATADAARRQLERAGVLIRHPSHEVTGAKDKR